MNGKAYLYHIYCKVKTWIQRENQVIKSDQDVHIYECSGDGRWTLGPEWVPVITIFNVWDENTNA
jgi:hypothetical protein